MAAEKKHISYTPVIAMLGATLCYASVPIFLKHFSHQLDYWTTNGIRYGIASLFWLPYVLMNFRRIPAGRNVWIDALIPAVANLLGQVFWAMCPYFNDANIVGFVIRSSFLFTTIFGFIILPSERVLIRKWLFWSGVLLSIIGVAALYNGGLTGGRTSPLGLLILLITALFWGLYAVYVKRYMHGYPVRLSFGVICIYTTIGLEILMLVFGKWQEVSSVGTSTWTLLVLSAIFGIAFSHVLYYYAIHAMGPIISTGIQLLGPFLTAVGSMFLLKEIMSPLQWIGGILLVLGSFTLIAVRYRIANPKIPAGCEPDIR